MHGEIILLHLHRSWKLLTNVDKVVSKVTILMMQPQRRFESMAESFKSFVGLKKHLNLRS